MENLKSDVMEIENSGGICIVLIQPRELDSARAEELSSHLLALLNEGNGKKFLLDFDSVRYMESACLGALVTFVKELSRRDGKIVIANVSENVRFLFAVTGLDKIFPIYRDVPTAMEAL
ncbi:MAG: STAS domain-containing protein [Phycisphaerales bacterium]|nr:STAS domain-containing protein [Phycisphaerales bacterium]